MSDILQSCLPSLLEPWQGPGGKPLKSEASADKRAHQKALVKRLWEAIGAGNLASMKEALDEGASPNDALNGVFPFWACVQQQRYDLAAELEARGCDVNRSCRGMSVWGAIASRDDPAEAQILLALVKNRAEPGTVDFVPHKAIALLDWLVDHNPQVQFSRPAPGGASWTAKNHQAEVLVALRGSRRVFDSLNRCWGINSNALYSLIDLYGVGIAFAVWEEIARRDDVKTAQRALSNGWGPPRSQDMEKATKKDVLDTSGKKATPLFGHLGWYFLHKGATNLWTWWMAQPELAKEFIQAAQSSPEQTLFEISVDLSRLKNLHALGIDLGMKNESGDSFLHTLVQGPFLSQAMVEWWLKERPGDLEALNKQGLRPMDQRPGPNARPALIARAKKVWLDHRLKGPTAPNQRQRL